MSRNLYRTLAKIVEPTTKATAAQGKPLNSLAQVILDNRISLNNKVVEHKKAVSVPLLISSNVLG